MRMDFLTHFDFLAFKPITNLDVVLRVLFALLVGFLIGVEREHKNRPAGLRTHVLVCLGACSIALLESVQLHTSLVNADKNLNIGITIGRMSAQVISGIGFLGAGTIFTAQTEISGLTTAARLWNVACLGLMIGFGYYWLAFCIAVLVILVLYLLGRFIRINTVKHVEVKFTNRAESLKFINEYFASNGVSVLDIDFHIETLESVQNKSLYTNIYTLRLPGRLSYTDIVSKLTECPSIQTVRTRSV